MRIKIFLVLLLGLFSVYQFNTFAKDEDDDKDEISSCLDKATVEENFEEYEKNMDRCYEAIVKNTTKMKKCRYAANQISFKKKIKSLKRTIKDLKKTMISLIEKKLADLKQNEGSEEEIEKLTELKDKTRFIGSSKGFREFCKKNE